MVKEPIRVADMEKCCGCGACINVCPRDAISFSEDRYGFIFPDVDPGKCVHCGLCKDVCLFPEVTAGRRQQPRKAFAAVNRDEEALKASSSGGVFAALADLTLQRNGVVCGCVMDSDMHVMHICAEKREDVLRMRGSKYVQSDVGLVYREVKERLQKGQFVLFTGTPCQVEALYAVLKNVQTDTLITADLVCHGVPSARMFRMYIAYLEQKYRTKINGFNFRSKRYGWQRWTNEFVTEQGKTRNIGKINEFYIPAFTTGNIMRSSCLVCKHAGPQRVGDITIADLWGQEKFDLPFDTSYGVSLCTLNTEAGMALRPELEKYLRLSEIDYEIAARSNHCLQAPTAVGTKREQYMAAIEEGHISRMAASYIRSHRKAILRSKLRMLVPLKLFVKIRKAKYGPKK